jgi:hypothetical protein
MLAGALAASVIRAGNRPWRELAAIQAAREEFRRQVRDAG